MKDDLLKGIADKLIGKDLDQARTNGTEDKIVLTKPAEETDTLNMQVHMELAHKTTLPIYLDRILMSSAEFLGISYDDLMKLLGTYHILIREATEQVEDTTITEKENL